jgi:hypothetical protein
MRGECANKCVRMGAKTVANSDSERATFRFSATDVSDLANSSPLLLLPTRRATRLRSRPGFLYQTALSSRLRYENSMWVSACRWPKLSPFINVVGEPELGRVGIAGYIEEVSRVAPKSETLYKE